jgi:hypothetical protein
MYEAIDALGIAKLRTQAATATPAASDSFRVSPKSADVN